MYFCPQVQCYKITTRLICKQPQAYKRKNLGMVHVFPRGGQAKLGASYIRKVLLFLQDIVHVLTEHFICLYLVTWVENIWVRQWWAMKKSTSNTFTMKFGFRCLPTFQKFRLQDM